MVELLQSTISRSILRPNPQNGGKVVPLCFSLLVCVQVCEPQVELRPFTAKIGCVTGGKSQFEGQTKPVQTGLNPASFYNEFVQSKRIFASQMIQ